MLNDTDVSGRRSGVAKKGRKTALACRATLERGFVLAAKVCFDVQYTWRLGFFSGGKTLDF